MRGTALLNLGYEAWNAAEASTRDRLRRRGHGCGDAGDRAAAVEWPAVRDPRPGALVEWRPRRRPCRLFGSDPAGLGLNSTDLRQFRGSLREVAADTTPDGRQGFAGLALILAAVEDYDLAIPPDSTDGRALLSRASALASIGEHEMARDDYTRVLAVDPGSSAATLGRAVALLALGEFEESLPDFDRAVEALPNEAIVYSQRGRAHGQIAANTEDPSTIHTHATQAIADLKASLAIDRTQSEEWQLLGDSQILLAAAGEGLGRQSRCTGRRSRPRSGPSPRRSS